MCVRSHGTIDLGAVHVGGGWRCWHCACFHICIPNFEKQLRLLAAQSSRGSLCAVPLVWVHSCTCLQPVRLQGLPCAHVCALNPLFIFLFAFCACILAAVTCLHGVSSVRHTRHRQPVCSAVQSLLFLVHSWPVNQVTWSQYVGFCAWPPVACHLWLFNLRSVLVGAHVFMHHTRRPGCVVGWPASPRFPLLSVRRKCLR